MLKQLIIFSLLVLSACGALPVSPTSPSSAVGGDYVTTGTKYAPGNAIKQTISPSESLALAVIDIANILINSGGARMYFEIEAVGSSRTFSGYMDRSNAPNQSLHGYVHFTLVQGSFDFQSISEVVDALTFTGIPGTLALAYNGGSYGTNFGGLHSNLNAHYQGTY